MSRVHILGAGTPTPTPERFGSAYVLETKGGLLMVDCGPAATHKLTKAGFKTTAVDHLFFTHHHFDHDVDYPCFLLTRWDQGAGRIPDLNVFGPSLTEEITEKLIGEAGAFAHDWRARVNTPVSQRVHVNRGGALPRRPPRVNARDIGPGQRVSGPDWEVTTSFAKHAQPWLDSIAYRFETDDGSVVITGDTEPCEPVLRLAKGADMMLCMCWDDQETMRSNGEAESQCGTTCAAEMAQEAGVRRLVLVHMGPNVSTDVRIEKGLGDIRRIYDGEVIVSQELTAIELRSGRIAHGRV